MNHFARFQWIILFCTMNTVSCQVKVEGFIEEDVLLPCFYRGDDRLPSKVTTYWRDKDDKVVLDIVQSNNMMSTQDQRFRGRVVSFSDLYQKGNFSIVLQKVQQSDSGLYECHIRTMEFVQRVQLTVAGKVSVVTTTPVPRAGNAAVTPNPPFLTLLSVPVFLFCGLN